MDEKEKENQEEIQEEIAKEQNKDADVEQESIEEMEGIEVIDIPDEEEPKNIWQKIVYKYKAIKRTKAGGIAIQVGTSLIMLLLAAGVGIFLAVGKAKGGPEVFADQYFGYFSSGNWYSMFEATELEESKFINRNTFGKCMSEHSLLSEVDTYEVDLVEEEDGYALVKIDYKLKEIDSDSLYQDFEEDTSETEAESQESEEETTQDLNGSCTMRLKKQDEKILFFYTTWKGDVEDYILENCKITIPQIFTVTFDDENIDEFKGAVNEENGCVTYTIDRIFEGSHTIKISGDGIDTYTYDVVWEEDGSSLEKQLTDFALNQEAMNSIENQTVDVLVSFYTSALNGGSVEDITSKLAASEEVMASVNEQYKALKNTINMEDGTTLVDLQINDYEIVVDSYNYMTSIDVTLNYSASYNAKRSRSVINGVRQRYTGSNTASMKMQFSYVEGVWKPNNVSMQCIDYSVEDVPQE